MPRKDKESNSPRLDETAGVGADEGTPVTEGYEDRANKFTGKIHTVETSNIERPTSNVEWRCRGVTWRRRPAAGQAK